MQELHVFINKQTLHFLTLYEERNIHKAADKLGLSQPALTMSLKSLEHQLNCELFHRTAKGIEATVAGNVFYRYAVNLRKSAEYAKLEVDSLTKGYRGTLRIGVGIAWATTILPDILAIISKDYPDLSLDVITGVADQLANKLGKGQLDIILTASPVQLLNAPTYTCIPVTQLSMVALANPNHQIFNKRKKVEITKLLEYPWAGFYEDPDFIEQANRFFSYQGLGLPDISMRSNSVYTVLSFVKRTSSITVISNMLEPIAHQMGLETIPLNAPLWSIPVNIYQHQCAQDLPALSILTELIKQSAN